MMAPTNATGPLRRSRRWWLMLSVLVGMAAFTYLRPSRNAATAVTFGGRTMGTTYRVVLGPSGSAADLHALQQSVDSLLLAINTSMSTYDPQSELSRFNAFADTTPVAISAAFRSVVQQALDVYAASDGHFDVTVGPLVDAWGFGAAQRAPDPPSRAMLDSLRAFVGSDKLWLDEQGLSKSDARVRVDLSAIAKGFAVDQVSVMLTARGLPEHLVEIGGELRGRGLNVRGEPFRVGIEEPDPDRITVRLAVALDDRSLASSGNYRNFYEVDGVRYAHTIDPRTGAPVRHTLLAVSVLHVECSLADAWATALMAAGADKAWSLAQANGLDVLLLIDGGDGRVGERLTAGFQRAVRRVPN